MVNLRDIAGEHRRRRMANLRDIAGEHRKRRMVNLRDIAGEYRRAGPTTARRDRTSNSKERSLFSRPRGGCLITRFSKGLCPKKRTTIKQKQK